MPLTRRDFLLGAAAAGGLAAVAGHAAGATDLDLDLSSLTAPLHDLGLPSNSPLDTIVVVMMENRSFDHYLGWLPGAAGSQRATYLEDDGVPHDTRPWAPDYKGCGFVDPHHSWGSGREQLGYEARDGSGFRKNGEDDYCLGYYGPSDVPVWKALTEQATIFDHYFAALLGPTYPNRWYMHGATSGGRKTNDFPIDMTTNNPIEGYRDTTIWDRCNAAGVSWAYYYSNLPFVGLYGADFVLPNIANIRHVSSFHADAAAGLLPHVCFVDPFFTVEGLANDDHPHADIRLGQQFLSDVIRSFVESPQWRSGALFVNYDEWGGFFDTVVPEPAPDDDRKTSDLNTDFSQRGFRTPATVVSPFAPRGSIAKHTYDHTSILKFIEWRFGLAPLTRRDASARNIGEILDFSSPDKSDVAIPWYVAPPDARIPCDAGDAFEPIDLVAVRDTGLADALGLRTDYRFEHSYRSF